MFPKKRERLKLRFVYVCLHVGCIKRSRPKLSAVPQDSLSFSLRKIVPPLMSSPDASAVTPSPALDGLSVDTSQQTFSNANNVDNGALSSAPDSPAIQSPPTNELSPPVKIDIDYAQRESDVRHEPLNISLDNKSDDLSSTRAQLATPANPATIPIEPPHGTPPPPTGQLLEDVEMAEKTQNEYEDEFGTNGVKGEESVNGINGQSAVVEADKMSVDTPVASSSRMSESRDVLGEMDQPPPAKRARKLSDADQASLAHSPAQPPPSTTMSFESNRFETPTPPKERKATLTPSQFRFCISTVRNLRKSKDAAPYLTPVDPVALNIPHYFSIIKHPMDFQTIDRKLASSNPQKPDPNPNNPRYLNADEFIADVRLMFSNAALFNGPEHAVTIMGRRVEAVFDKQIKQMPPPAEEPPAPKKVPTPPPPVQAPVPAKKVSAARRPSTSVPTIRRNETAETARPKREIHPPPPKDLPYAELPKKMRAARRPKLNDGSEEQLRFCSKVLSDLHKKSLYNIASHFYEPVDPVKLNIPQYPKIIKKPMDLSTMRRKLDSREYGRAEDFLDDFNLMIRNCMTFNPAGTVVHDAGVELQRVFGEKWANLPPLKAPQAESDEEEDDDEESEDDHRIRTIAELEAQMEALKGNIAALKQPKKEKKKKEKKPAKQVSPVPAPSKANGKPAKSAAKKRSAKKNVVADDDVLSFDQKKDLSEAIQNLDGDKLERVTNIIYEGVPEIRDSAEEIELDIDQLPAPLLLKLYNLVVRPMKVPTTKRTRTGTGTGTGGLKRKSMDEDIEAEKIRRLEERMKMFDQRAAGSVVTKMANDSEHSSDESSSDSSGSDSE